LRVATNSHARWCRSGRGAVPSRPLSLPGPDAADRSRSPRLRGPGGGDSRRSTNMKGGLPGAGNLHQRTTRMAAVEATARRRSAGALRQDAARLDRTGSMTSRRRKLYLRRHRWCCRRRRDGPHRGAADTGQVDTILDAKLAYQGRRSPLDDMDDIMRTSRDHGERAMLGSAWRAVPRRR